MKTWKKADVEAIIVEAIADQLKGVFRSEITDEKRLFIDLGCDFLNYVEIMLTCEETFDLRGGYDFERVDTVGKLKALWFGLTGAEA